MSRQGHLAALQEGVSKLRSAAVGGMDEIEESIGPAVASFQATCTEYKRLSIEAHPLKAFHSCNLKPAVILASCKLAAET